MTKFTLLAILGLAGILSAQDKPVDGSFPPPAAPVGTWESLLAGKLTDHWTGMSMAIDSPLIKTMPNPDQPGEIILHIDRGPTGLIRSMKPYENFILEMQWRHLTGAPSANGNAETSGNSGLLIAHGPFPNVGGPYPPEGHEVQVCNLGNGSWYTSHGDLFSLPGTNSKATPDPRFAISHTCGHRSMPVEFHGKPTGEWNHVRLTCVDGTLQQEMNGKLVTALYRISPRKGYLSFESEGGPVEFRNMRLQELTPDPDLAAKHLAPMLHEPMACAYLTERKATPLPTGNFLLMVDLKEAISADEFITGLELPKLELKGRVLLAVRDGKYDLLLNQKPVQDQKSPPVPAGAAPVLHLDLKPAAIGHALVLTPIKAS
jgi:hypothetical protein